MYCKRKEDLYREAVCRFSLQVSKVWMLISSLTVCSSFWALCLKMYLVILTITAWLRHSCRTTNYILQNLFLWNSLPALLSWVRVYCDASINLCLPAIEPKMIPIRTQSTKLFFIRDIPLTKGNTDKLLWVVMVSRENGEFHGLHVSKPHRIGVH